MAELERTGRLMVVVDLEGCVHAESFGQLAALTDAQEWRLISAALDAWEALQCGRPELRAAQ